MWNVPDEHASDPDEVEERSSVKNCLNSWNSVGNQKGKLWSEADEEIPTVQRNKEVQSEILARSW